MAAACSLWLFAVSSRPVRSAACSAWRAGFFIVPILTIFGHVEIRYGRRREHSSPSSPARVAERAPFLKNR